MRLSREIIDFLRPHLFDYVAQPGPIGNIAVVEIQARALLGRIGIDRVQPLGVECCRSPDNSMYLLTFGEQYSARNEPSWPVIPEIRAFLTTTYV